MALILQDSVQRDDLVYSKIMTIHFYLPPSFESTKYHIKLAFALPMLSDWSELAEARFIFTNSQSDWNMMYKEVSLLAA